MEFGSAPSPLEEKICVANEILFIVHLKPVWLQTNVTPTNSTIKKKKKRKKTSVTVKFQMNPQANPTSAPSFPHGPEILLLKPCLTAVLEKSHIFR